MTTPYVQTRESRVKRDYIYEVVHSYIDFVIIATESPNIVYCIVYNFYIDQNI